MRIFYRFLLLTLVSQPLQAQFCHPQDSLQLIKFYNATNGPTWTITWDFSQPVKNWEGIQLNPQGRVKSIWLPGKNLSGTLPADLDLPELYQLGLPQNKISGPAPKFALLPKLSTLALNNNQLTGAIPHFDSPYLQSLELYYNQLTGEIPKFNLPNLIALYLHNNQLTGEIPEFDTPQLGALSLGYNQLTGSIPDFKNMPKLSHLECPHNQLSGSLPGFSNLVNLEWLVLEYNELTGSVPDFQLPQLETVLLGNNRLDGNLSSLNLPHLRILDLRNNQLQGAIPDMILPQLFNLNLSGNQLSGNIPGMDFPELGILNLSGNQLSGPIPNMNLPELYNLNLSKNQLSGHLPDFGSGLIESLRLGNNRFTFGNLEEWVDTNRYVFEFAPQAKIPLNISGNLFSVSAGGTLANNTYFWYRDSVLVDEKKGDSTFVADQPGSYFCQVFNSILSDPASGDSLVLVSEMHSHTVSAAEVFDNPVFRVFPNPLPEGEVLQILLENDFSGAVKFEILSLDGRVLHTFFEEKTGLNVGRVLNPSNVGGSAFYVRISDGEKSAARLVLRP